MTVGTSMFRPLWLSLKYTMTGRWTVDEGAENAADTRFGPRRTFVFATTVSHSDRHSGFAGDFRPMRKKSKIPAVGKPGCRPAPAANGGGERRRRDRPPCPPGQAARL